MNIFAEELFRNPFYFWSTVLAVIFSVCLHEYSHAFAALKCGDTTARDAGHLTLNPLKQMGGWSLAMLLILGLCWGAVPVNPRNVTRRQRIAIALAGPLTNLVLAILFFLLCTLAYHVQSEMLFRFSAYASRINLVLALLNLLPIPGLDGGAALMEILPVEKLRSSEFAKGTMVLLMLLLLFSIGNIFRWADQLLSFLLNLIVA